MKTPFSKCRLSLATGFTLIELLAVVAIICILASLTVVSLPSIMAGNATTSAIAEVENVAVIARQTALSKGTPIAMAVSRLSTDAASDCQAVLLLSYETVTETWVPISAWTRLPSNVRAEVYCREGIPSFYTKEIGEPLSGDLPLKFRGTNPDYDYVIFQADGSVDSPKSGPTLTFRRSNKAVGASDYLLALQSCSGRSSIIEP